MIDRAYVQRMARYNRWQNESLYGVADALPDEERCRERGAFFGSIHKTLNHLLWADRMWMSRFSSDIEKPQVSIAGSVSLYTEWDGLKHARTAFDGAIASWADKIDDAWLEGDLAYFSRTANREIHLSRWLAVTHMFNHQTHHRGQVHCLLTQAGGKPHDTDMPAMPE